jgi:hypothetical protein
LKKGFQNSFIYYNVTKPFFQRGADIPPALWAKTAFDRFSGVCPSRRMMRDTASFIPGIPPLLFWVFSDYTMNEPG